MKVERKTLVRFLIRPKSEELFAVFPQIKYGFNGYRNDLLVCYAHIGQHGSAAPEYIRECRKATEIEYKDLLNELTNQVGYNLRVCKK